MLVIQTGYYDCVWLLSVFLNEGYRNMSSLFLLFLFFLLSKLLQNAMYALVLCLKVSLHVLYVICTSHKKIEP
jgi:hypothetical protein